jgi:uncharacterized protein (DUF1330 family)
MSKKGYWVATIEVSDPEKYKPYIAMVQGILAKFGGRFLVRGGTSEAVEGKLRPRMIVIEFPDYATARECYFSAEYAAAKAVRLSASVGDVVIVEGFDGPQPS